MHDVRVTRPRGFDETMYSCIGTLQKKLLVFRTKQKQVYRWNEIPHVNLRVWYELHRPLRTLYFCAYLFVRLIN